MELRHLDTLLAIVEHGSFTAAADALHTVQSNVTTRLKQLEADLGVRLLNRTTRAVAATELGQAYYERIRLVLEELDALEESVKNSAGRASGRLKLTAPLSFGNVQLTPALVDFATRYPGINLDVSFSDRIVNLVDEGFDAAVRIGFQSDNSLIARKLCESRIIVAASPEYLAAHGTPQAPEDLAALDCIVDTNFRDRNGWRFQRAGEPLTVSVRSKIYFSSADACIAAAAAGLGIVQVPSFVAGAHIRAGRIVPLLTAFETAPMPVQVIYPPGRHLAQKVRVLVDFLADRFRGQPEWEQGWV